jgi:hypothetical protein
MSQTECIIAKQKPRTQDGYVTVHRRNYMPSTDYAHRIAYEDAKGEIPEGYTIDHLCRVRNCINPEHLEAVTLAENIRRQKKRNACGHDPSELVGRCPACKSIHNKRWYSKKRGMVYAAD